MFNPDIAYDKSKSANFNQTTVDAIDKLLGISSLTTTSSTATPLGTLTTPQLIGIVVGSIFGAGLLLLLLSVFGSSILSCLTSFCSCCIGFPCCCCRGFFAASFGACESDCRPICTPVTAECTPCATPCATPRPVFVPPVKRFVSTTAMASCAPAANYSVNVNNCSGLSTSSQYCGAATSGYRSGSMCARKNCHTYLPQMPVSGNGMMGCSSRVTNIVNKRVDDCGC
ncbi:hypothetical protein HELRODRAFT_159986 [Helobdella robusta]|uniref:Uncharacterized protein n=1 Tax=Helobdella robusta TaxID=6412 RepID=T1EPM3_HELRO|nr:hypothetical protein HELRODRAFT_159986 [Helobdella robusta]ESO05896.1 hypothetical protein HELRODRAFT_159986 [Helobdella robusta]